MSLNKLQKQALARQVRKKGVEMTPDEAGLHLDAAFVTIRKKMLEQGHVLPDDDDELRELIRLARKGRDEPI